MTTRSSSPLLAPLPLGLPSLSMEATVFIIIIIIIITVFIVIIIIIIIISPIIQICCIASVDTVAVAALHWWRKNLTHQI